jgi:D-glycero-alpha-D-manno-heptose 1-phosphate guanylyltransferase
MAEKMEAGFRSYSGGLEIEFQREESPLGTGGAIYRALREAGTGGVFAVNGDTYFPADLRRFQNEAHRLGGSLAIALRRVPDVSRYGAVDVDGGRILAMNENGRSGPGLVNAGLYLLPGDLWRKFPDVFSWEMDLLQPQAALLQAAGVTLDAPFLDIGTPESYAKAETILPKLPGHTGAGAGNN